MWARSDECEAVMGVNQVVCTIGPATWDREKLFRLADEGMSVARLNMSHGDHASHKKVLPRSEISGIRTFSEHCTDTRNDLDQ